MKYYFFLTDLFLNMQEYNFAKTGISRYYIRLLLSNVRKLLKNLTWKQ